MRNPLNGLLLVCAIGFLITEWNGMFGVARPGRFERNMVMKASHLPARMRLREMFFIRKAQHWGGLAFVSGNVLFVVNKLDEMSRLFLSRPMPDVISGRDGLLIVIGQVALIIGHVVR